MLSERYEIYPIQCSLTYNFKLLTNNSSLLAKSEVGIDISSGSFRGRILVFCLLLL